ncbi:MAG: PAS domain-containing protein, partial [bacterium]
MPKVSPTDTRHANHNGTVSFLLLLVFVFLAAGIIGVGYIYYRHLERAYDREVGRKLSAVAELKVADLVQWRQERLMDGAVFFKNQSFSTLVRRFFENPADENVQRQLLDWLGKYPAHGVYNQVRLLDGKGVSRLVLPAGQAKPCSVIVRDAVNVQRSGRMTVQDFYRNDEDQRIYLAVMIPILDEAGTGHPLGVLVLRIDPTTYLYPFIQHWPTNSPSAETQLLRRDGNEVLYLNNLRHRGNTALTMRVTLASTNILAVKAALGQTGIVSGVDYRGVAVMGIGQVVPDSSWLLISKMDTAEIREPLRHQFWQIVMVVSAMLFGAGTTVALLWKQQHVRSLSEKMAAATALAEMSRLMSESQKIAHLGSFEYGIDARTTVWSEEEFNIYGLNPAEPSPDYELMLAKYIHPDDVAVLNEAVTRAMHNGSTYELEHRIVRPDGSVRFVYDKAHPIFDSNGRLVKYIGATLDISERKLAEKRIVEKEAKIRLLLDSTAEAIYGLDLDGNCTFCNSACLSLLGYTLPGELLGKNMHWHIHSKHSDGSPFPVEACRIFQAFKKGEPVHVDDEVLWRADGTSFPAEYWSFPQCNDGVVVGAVVTFLNIAERKGLEAEKRQLAEQNRQLQKSESLGRMAGAIAHHFNNQLQVVQGYLDLVIGELPPGDSHIEELATAMQAAKTAADVSSLMLTYLGQQQVKSEVVDLAELCRMNLPLLQEGQPTG